MEGRGHWDWYWSKTRMADIEAAATTTKFRMLTKFFFYWDHVRGVFGTKVIAKSTSTTGGDTNHHHLFQRYPINVPMRGVNGQTRV